MQSFDLYEVDNLTYFKKSLSTVSLTMFDRTNLNKFINSTESSLPSVYILYSDNVIGQSSMYIGETENIGKRLQQHDKNFGKTFWTKTIILQTTDSSFNKAHFKHLEYLFYERAKFADRYRLANKVIPTKSSLSIADSISANMFFEESLDLLLKLRFYFFEHPQLGETSEDKDIFYLYHPFGTSKLQVLNEDSFNLLEGSIIVIEDEESYKEEKKEYIKKGDIEIIPDTKLGRLKTNIKFKSDNEAAIFASADIDADWTLWTNIDGHTTKSAFRRK